MNNRCMLEQLGYKLDDKRVKIDSDDYITAWIDDNISIGANRDCTSIVLGTYNETLLQIDLFLLGRYAIVNITVPYTTVGGTDVTEHGVVYPKNMGEFLPSEIVDHIVTTVRCNEEPPKGINNEELAEMIGRAIKPMIMMHLSNEIDIVSGDEAR